MQRIIYINSSYASSGSNEDFQITKSMENFTKFPKQVKLLSANIPYTWDNIFASSNQLTVD